MHTFFARIAHRLGNGGLASRSLGKAGAFIDWDKWWFTPFCGWSQATAFMRELSKAITFCLTSYQFHIRTRLIGRFPLMYRSWSCAEEKLNSTPVHTLRQLKRDEGLFPPLPISLADRNRLKNLPRQIFSACVKFGGNPCRDVETA